VLSGFLSVLFNPDEQVWLLNEYKTGQSCQAMSQEQAIATFNEMVQRNPTDKGICIGVNPAGPARLVSGDPVRYEGAWFNRSGHKCFRNILIEFDMMNQYEQAQIISNSGLPWSTLTWSGGKGFHVVIALTEPISWDDVGRFHRKIVLSLDSKADPVNNSDHSTKAPGGKRLTNDVVCDQLPHAARRRITIAELNTWLDQFKPKWFQKDWLWEQEHKDVSKLESYLQGKGLSMEKKDWTPVLKAYLEQVGHSNVGMEISCPCPVCREKGHDNSGTNLSINIVAGLFTCHRKCDGSQIGKMLKTLTEGNP
jgi:hypothetical protein